MGAGLGLGGPPQATPSHAVCMRISKIWSMTVPIKHKGESTSFVMANSHSRTLATAILRT